MLRSKSTSKEALFVLIRLSIKRSLWGLFIELVGKSRLHVQQRFVEGLKTWSCAPRLGQKEQSPSRLFHLQRPGWCCLQGQTRTYHQASTDPPRYSARRIGGQRPTW